MKTGRTLLALTMATSVLIAAGTWQHYINTHFQNDLADLRLQLASLRQAGVTAEQELENLGHQQHALKDEILELARLRNEVTRLRQQAAGKTDATASNSNATLKPVTEEDVTAFLQRKAGEQGQLLGVFRSRMARHDTNSPEELIYWRTLATKIRPQLEFLESHPDDFASFQT